jgi:hypothetical protein
MNTVKGLTMKQLHAWSKDTTIVSLKGTLVDASTTGISDVELAALDRSGSEVTTVKLICNAVKEKDSAFTASYILKNEKLAQIVKWEKKTVRHAYWKHCEAADLQLKAVKTNDRGSDFDRALFSIRAEVFNPTAHSYYLTQDLAIQGLDGGGFEICCFEMDLRETIESGMIRVVNLKEARLTSSLLPKVSQWKLIPSQGRLAHGLPEDHD